MKLFWKGAAALTLAITGLGAAAVPAQAQHYGGQGWRGDRGHDRRWNDHRRDDRRWNNRRGDRRDWRGYHGYNRPGYRNRARCWTQWRYDHYRDRNVRVRVCR
jgi:hypothetical protein